MSRNIFIIFSENQFTSIVYAYNCDVFGILCYFSATFCQLQDEQSGMKMAIYNKAKENYWKKYYEKKVKKYLGFFFRRVKNIFHSFQKRLSLVYSSYLEENHTKDHISPFPKFGHFWAIELVKPKKYKKIDSAKIYWN